MVDDDHLNRPPGRFQPQPELFLQGASERDQVRQRGSHRQFKHASKPGLVTDTRRTRPTFPAASPLVAPATKSNER
jgi:hypothetical protein